MVLCLSALGSSLLLLLLFCFVFVCLFVCLFVFVLFSFRRCRCCCVVCRFGYWPFQREPWSNVSLISVVLI